MIYNANDFTHRVALARTLVTTLEDAGFSQSEEEKAREIVMERAISPWCVIKVYTSCDLDKDGNPIARGEGSDAIRVCAVDTERGRGYIKAPRVTRGARSSVERISERTIERARSVWKMARERAVQQGRA